MKTRRLIFMLFLMMSLFAVSARADTSEEEIKHAKQLSHQAGDLFRHGKYQEAITLHQQSLAIYEKTLGSENATAISLNNLAYLYQTIGQYKQALPLYQRALSIREKILGPEHADTVTNINHLAGLYISLGQYDQASPLYQRALAIVEKVLGPEHAETATSLSSLAGMYVTLGRYDQALPLIQRALAIDEKVLGPEHADTVTNLANLAQLYGNLGQFDKALPLAQRALAIDEKVLGPEHVNTASSLNSLGWLYRNLGLYEKALPLYQRCLAIREKVLGSEHEITATNIINLADLYTTTGHYDQALPLYLRAVAIKEKVLGPEHVDTATSLSSLATFYKTIGQYDKARLLYLRALTIEEKTLGSEHVNVAFLLSSLAQMYQTLGLYDKALPLYQRALAIDERTHGPEHADTSTDLNNLAILYQTIGYYDQALLLFQRGLAIDEKVLGSEHTNTASSLNVLASLYVTIGHYDKALPLYLRALAIQEKALGPEHVFTAASINNLAYLYVTLGQYKQALPLYQRALAIHEKALGPEHANTAICLTHLAGLYDLIGQYDQALPLCQRALAIKEKVLGPDHADTAISLSNLAGLYQNLGQYNKALPLYQRALTITEKVLDPDHVYTAAILNHLASLYQILGQYDTSFELFQRAYRSVQSGRVLDMLKQVQGNMGGFYAAQGNPSAAIFYLKGAVNTMQSIRADSRGLDKALQKSLLKKNEDVYKKLANLLVASGRLAEAQQVLTMLKEDEYFDFIRRDSQANARGTRMNYSGAEKPFAERLEMLGNNGAVLVDQLNALNKLAKLGLTPEQDEQRSHIKTELAEQAKQTFSLLNDIPKELPAAQLRQLEQQRAEQVQLAAGVQSQLAQLGPGVTLIQYLLLGDKIQILLTDSKQQVAREAPLGEAALYPKLVALRKALEDPRHDPRPLAQELYQSLIAPIESDIKASQTLMLSLDGALRYIPFSALYDGKQYLVERYRLSIYTAAAKDKLAAAATQQWKINGLGVTQAHPGFIALPGVKAELEGIVGPLCIPGKSYLDQEFTAHQMQDSLKQGYSVLHLASHFKFTPGTEADSYLLLGDGSHLSLKDIRQGDYPFGQLDLLTLSACATAMHGGQETNGKEVEGFGALAQNKGAKGVLATLWPIADESTAQLMQTLYRGRQQQHLSKAEALRQAQLSLLKGGKTHVASEDERGVILLTENKQNVTAGIPFLTDPNIPFAHPYFWAPFILMGNWL